MKGHVSIQRAGTRFSYACVFNDHDISTDMETGNVMGTEAYAITVPEADVGLDESRSQVVWYKLRAERSDGKVNVVHRRFRDFHGVDGAIRANYKGQAVLKSFPRLPQRKIALFQDHFSQEFIQDRIVKLQVCV